MTKKKLFLVVIVVLLVKAFSWSQNILNWHQNFSSGFSNNSVKNYSELNNHEYHFWHNELGFSRTFFERHKISLRVGFNLHYERQVYKHLSQDEYGISIPVKEVCQNYNLLLNNEVVAKLFEINKRPVLLAIGCQMLFINIENDYTFIDGTKNYSNHDFGFSGKIYQNTNLLYPVKTLKNNGALELSAGYGFQVYAENFFIDRYNYFRLGLNWKMGKKDRESEKAVSAP